MDCTTFSVPYEWSIKHNGLIVLCENDPFGNSHRLSEAPSPPYFLCASLPGESESFAFEIRSGQSPVWEHRVTDSINVSNSERVIVDSIIFGVRNADGTETLKRLFHDGSHAVFSSLADARAHRLI
jgi:hypothetical protein